jgi:hypothetical protein
MFTTKFNNNLGENEEPETNSNRQYQFGHQGKEENQYKYHRVKGMRSDYESSET